MTRQTLITAGVDYDQGLRRFAGKTALYEKFLLKFFDDDCMERLHSQLQLADHADAFRMAHDLKGTSGNLSMNEFYDAICRLVETLRAGGSDETIQQQYQQALECYNAVYQAVKEGGQ